MKRNKFSLSNSKLLSCDMGELVPIGLFEVLPGDTIQHATSALVRAAPLVSPVMHPVHVRIHHFYVPYRIIWNGFEDFITGGPDGNDATVWPHYTIFAAGGVGAGTPHDYMGVPPGVNIAKLSALPMRAYNMIWNEFYRDQDLQAEIAVSLNSGVDSSTGDAMQACGWEKDYFTSARPFTQKGPSITVPIGTSAPVVPDTPFAAPTLRTVADASSRSWNAAVTSNAMSIGGAGLGASSGVGFVTTGLHADLTNASAVTITALREAMALQRFEEARARYGSRYTEYLRYLGVRSSDARLQRPEYLGGGKQTLQFSEVLQTGPSASPDAANTVGALKGHGIGALRSNRYRRFIEEHGLVLSLMSIRPKTIYQDGVPRLFSKDTRFKYHQRELEHIGQQEIQKKEIYAASASPDGVWGYQDRYDDYRRQESTVAGEFRSTLNYWHMSRTFGSEPALNASFIKCVPTERTFASNTTDVMYVMVNHSIQARRMLSRTGKSFIF